MNIRALRREKIVVQDILFNKLISDRKEKRKVFLRMKKTTIKLPRLSRFNADIERLESKTDCAKYDSCLREAAILNEPSLKCHKCKTYKQSPLSIIDYCQYSYDGEYDMNDKTVE